MMLPLNTASRAFGGEVEASRPPTICRLPDSRRHQVSAIAPNPTAEWVARQITEAFPWDEVPHYPIRDRDRIYGSVVTRRLRAMGIRDKPTHQPRPGRMALPNG